MVKRKYIINIYECDKRENSVISSKCKSINLENTKVLLNSCKYLDLILLSLNLIKLILIGSVITCPKLSQTITRNIFSGEKSFNSSDNNILLNYLRTLSPEVLDAILRQGIPKGNRDIPSSLKRITIMLDVKFSN